MQYLFYSLNSITAFGFDDITSFLNDNVIGSVTDSIGQMILYNIVYRILYYLACAFCKLINILDLLTEAFTGSRKVYFDGDTKFLVNIFFQNHTVSNIYWAMALLGIIFAFAFGIIAVVRRIFDLRDKDQRNMGQILTDIGKTVLLILSMNVIITLVLNTTNILMQQIDYIFSNAELLDKPNEIYFTEEQYAAMGRCLNTLGNYSLNPSADSRYNVNACFNEMRPDLDFLRRQGVFDFYYDTTENGTKLSVPTWQSVLQKIANSADLQKDLKMDSFNQSTYDAITEGMKELQNNPNLRPLSYYKRNYTVKREHIPLDRYIFLVCTFQAAKNEAYNKNPELTDPIRGPYYYGDKSIYDLKQVNEDFDIAVGAFNYLIMYFLGVVLVWDLAVIVMTCVTRIFNMLMLYLISPLVFAVEPLDDGAKRKQWVTAFLVQSMGIFGTIVAMRVLMIFIPIVMSPRLEIFKGDGIGYSILDVAAKVILIYGGFEAVKKANGIITGIIADSAGWQSIQAGDMSGYGERGRAFFKSFVTHPIATTGSTLSGITGIKAFSKYTGGDKINTGIPDNQHR
jgi:hypothetical protein